MVGKDRSTGLHMTVPWVHVTSYVYGFNFKLLFYSCSQCDRMASLFTKYSAIYNNENLPKSFEKKLP